jgi:hypothetical protein
MDTAASSILHFATNSETIVSVYNSISTARAEPFPAPPICRAKIKFAVAHKHSDVVRGRFGQEHALYEAARWMTEQYATFATPTLQTRCFNLEEISVGT